MVTGGVSGTAGKYWQISTNCCQRGKLFSLSSLLEDEGQCNRLRQKVPVNENNHLIQEKTTKCTWARIGFPPSGFETAVTER
jgi:hypothetical protein